MMCIPMVPRQHERGFALVAAIFIVVVLAMLGIMMVTIGGMERATASAAVQGTRGFYAARSGIEWGVYSALNNRAATCGAAAASPTTNTLNLTPLGLSGFTVRVVCSYTDHQEAGKTGSSVPVTPNQIKVFLITATATSGSFGEADYISRILQVTVTDAPPP